MSIAQNKETHTVTTSDKHTHTPRSSRCCFQLRKFLWFSASHVLSCEGQCSSRIMIIFIFKFSSELIKSLLDLEYKYEVTLQKISFLEKEKENFLNKYRLNLHGVEQRSGLRVKKIKLLFYPFYCF